MMIMWPVRNICEYIILYLENRSVVTLFAKSIVEAKIMKNKELKNALKSVCSTFVDAPHVASRHSLGPAWKSGWPSFEYPLPYSPSTIVYWKMSRNGKIEDIRNRKR